MQAVIALHMLMRMNTRVNVGIRPCITAATPDRSRGDATMTLEGVIRVALKKVFGVTFGFLLEENPLLAPPPLGSGQSSHGPTLAPDTAPAKIVKTHRIH